MSPAPRTLPVPRPVLVALDGLRNSNDPPTKARLIAVVVRAAHAPTTAPAVPSGKRPNNPYLYIQSRLLSGLSVSVRRTRLNFSLALIALIRSCDSPTSIASAAVAHFLDPDYDHDSSSSHRERTLGALAAATALVSAAAPTLSPSAARDVVRLLRVTTDTIAVSWRLAAPAAAVATKLLARALPPTRKALAKPLWEWAEARVSSDDGLILATALLSAGLATTPAFRKLYPDGKAPFASALAAPLKAGYSILDRPLVLPVSNANVVPPVWRAAITHAASPAARVNDGAVTLPLFWETVVSPSLLQSGKSLEKRLVAVQLVPLLLEHVSNVSVFQSVFTPDVARSLAQIESFVSRLGASPHRARPAADVKPGSKAGSSAEQRISSTLISLGPHAIEEFQASRRPADSRPQLVRAFLLWCVRGGILNIVFNPDSLSKVLADCDRDAAAALFAAAVQEFARPQNGDADGLKREGKTDYAHRSNITRFLFTLALQHTFLAEDLVKLATGYAVFKPVEKDAKKNSPRTKKLIKFDEFKIDEAASFLGVLLTPNPPLSHNSAEFMFRRLVNFLTESRKEATADNLALSSLEVVSKVISSKRSDAVPRCITSDDEETLEKLTVMLKGSVIPVIAKLSTDSEDDSNQPLRLSLKLIGILVGLCLFEPVDEIEEKKDASHVETRMIGDYESFVARLVECSQAVLSEKKSEEKKSNTDDEDVEPEPIERITHLIADLCGRQSHWFKQFGLRAIEPLGVCADDRVLAVLFDAMDSYLAGVKSLLNPDADNDEESDDDDVIEIDSADAEDAMQVDKDNADDDDDEGDNEKEADDDDSKDEKSNDEESVDNEDEAMDQNEVENENGVADVNGGSGFNHLPEDDSDIDVDINPDDEDPEVLSEFDRRLAAHVVLLRKKKKVGNERKMQEQLRDARVNRILALIECTAKVLRIRLVKENDVDRRLPIIFLDLHVRLYEFVLAEDMDNLRFLQSVIPIIRKQMIVPSAEFHNKITDTQSVLEITDRLFYAFVSYSLQRTPPPESIKVMAKSLGLFVGLSSSLSGDDCSRFVDIYKEMVRKMLHPDHFLITPELFTSCLSRSPSIALPLVKVVDDCFSKERITRNCRSSGAGFVAFLATQAVQMKTDSKDVVKKFWTSVEKLVGSHCKPDSAFKEWNAHGVAKLMEVVALGRKHGALSDFEGLRTSLLKSLDALKLIPSQHGEIAKRIELPSSSKKRRRDQPADVTKNVEGTTVAGTSDSTPQPKSSAKKRKSKKSAAITE